MFLPHERVMLSTVAASSAHFIEPFTMNSPNTNSISTNAPT